MRKILNLVPFPVIRTVWVKSKPSWIRRKKTVSFSTIKILLAEQCKILVESSICWINFPFGKDLGF